ncbi:CBS domain-containing protein [Nocardioides mangrovicus]|uniref:CBS domain-containing protein n=1 Tax=Nocardioides mangrovicus TaxID=2478913 RepID=A0A3L8P6F7_9ACTN|nr:CBS domain-containing protein [Nocardioides mangrovicus]RLV50990.1 CBS domain-containing protein [Nocardioides mangrovicus]
MLIKDVLATKPDSEVITIAPDAGVRELIAQLAEHNVGALVVSDDGSRVAGIVSERDVVRRLVDGDAVLEAPVSQIMTSLVASCGPGDDLDDLMALMTERRIRHVPVLEDDALVGVVSIGDVVKSRIGQLEFERDQLDSYVHQT